VSQETLFRLNLPKPIVGTVGSGDKKVTWEIWYIECPPIAADQASSPSDLVHAAHRRMRDEDGNVVPIKVLAKLDIEAGFRGAYRREHAKARAQVFAD